MNNLLFTQVISYYILQNKVSSLIVRAKEQIIRRYLSQSLFQIPFLYFKGSEILLVFEGCMQQNAGVCSIWGVPTASPKPGFLKDVCSNLLIYLQMRHPDIIRVRNCHQISFADHSQETFQIANEISFAIVRRFFLDRMFFY